MNSKSILLSLIISSALIQQLHAVHIGYKDESREDYSNPDKTIKTRSIVVDFKREEPKDLRKMDRFNTPNSSAKSKELASLLDTKVGISKLKILEEDIDIHFRNINKEYHLNVVQEITKELFEKHNLSPDIKLFATPANNIDVKVSNLTNLLFEDLDNIQNKMKELKFNEEEIYSTYSASSDEDS